VLEPLLLEVHTPFNFLAGHVNALWHNNQLIVVIAQTMQMPSADSTGTSAPRKYASSSSPSGTSVAGM
jgi:hypothetical protein